MLSALSEELIQLIQLRNFVQDEKSAPYDGRSWWPVLLAIQIAAEHAYPQYGLPQGWNLRWQLCRSVGVAIQRRPLNRLQQYFAAQPRIGSREQCCIQHVPRDDGKQSRSPHKPVERAELARLDAAAAFEHTVSRLDGPAPRVVLATGCGFSMGVRGLL